MRRPAILLVADDPACRRVLVPAIERMGFDTEAIGGGAALHGLGGFEPDLVLLDGQLIDATDGPALVRAIREGRPAAGVIALGGGGALDTALAAIRIGAIDDVAVSRATEELELRIRRAMEWRALLSHVARLECQEARPRMCTLRESERDQIQRALVATGGRRARAARLLGISERNLYRKIHVHQLESIARQAPEAEAAWQARGDT